jgi:hypothetical protein
MRLRNKRFWDTFLSMRKPASGDGVGDERNEFAAYTVLELVRWS